MSSCTTRFTFSFCLFHPLCLPSSIASGRATGLLTFIVISFELTGRPCTRIEMSVSFFSVEGVLHGNQLNTTSAVDVAESVQFGSWWTTSLRPFRTGGCSINLSKDFWVFWSGRPKHWAVCWALMAEALQDVQAHAELLSCKQVHFSPA